MTVSRFTQEYKDRRREAIRRQLGLQPRPIPQRPKIKKHRPRTA